MKYIEEIVAGDCFRLDTNPYLATYDFKKDGSRLCYSLITGHSIWLTPNTIVEIFAIYGLDNNNNIYPIKTITN
jgi:hypothetical protein